MCRTTTIAIRRGATQTTLVPNPFLARFRPYLTTAATVALLGALHLGGHLPRPRAFAVLLAWICARWLIAWAVPTISRVIVFDDERLVVQDAVRLPLFRKLLVERAAIVRVDHQGDDVVLHLREGAAVRLPLGRVPARELAEVLAEELSGGDGAELLLLGHPEELR